MLNLFEVNGFTRKVFEIMHDYLLAIWHEDCNSIVFWVLLQTSLSLLYFAFDLLETAQIDFV